MTARHLVTRFAAVASLLCLPGCTSSGSLTTQQSAYDCVRHAKQVLYDADFTENLVVARQTASVSGRHGGYEATVNCDGVDQKILVDVKGLDATQSEWYRDVIIRKF